MVLATGIQSISCYNQIYYLFTDSVCGSFMHDHAILSLELWHYALSAHSGRHVRGFCLWHRDRFIFCIFVYDI